MRSYGQFCGVARALDEVGDRWSLLIVRELLIRDCRYSDLREGLPGIATNLLADRLRALEGAGIVQRQQGSVGPPLYALTPRGRALAPVLRELALWSLPLMAQGRGQDQVRAHWLVLAVDALFHGADLSNLPPLRVVLKAEDATITLDVRPPGRLETRLGDAGQEDVRISGPVEAVIGALTGTGPAQAALVRGDVALLGQVQARAAGRPPAADPDSTAYRTPAASPPAEHPEHT